MTEPQTWTTIGVLAAALLGTITLMTTMLGRTITAQFGGLRSEIGKVDSKIDSLRNEMSVEIGSLRNEMGVEIGSLRNEMSVEIGSLRNEMVTGFDGLRAEMNARFEAVNMRFTTLDRDVQALSERVFRTE